jgi:hypothetical protein
MIEPQLTPAGTSQWGDQVRCSATLPQASIRCSLPRFHPEEHHRCDAVTPEVRWPVEGNANPEYFGVTETGFWSPLKVR